MSYDTRIPSKESHPIHKRQKRISYEFEELAWTAARCNRLLRSITQRIGTLRKIVDNDFTGSAPKPVKSVQKRLASHWSTQDPVWMGDGKRKAAAKTFKGRKKVTKPDHSQDVERSDGITFPSPFVRRLEGGGNGVETAASSSAPAMRLASPPFNSRQLRIQPGSPRAEPETGLLSAFSSILKATNPRGSQKPNGARSLMSTCLRNVPQYIALNEEDEEDDDVDSSAEILNYLEELGTKEQGGWSGLREVVRSQVMYAVCEAIEDDLLSDSVIKKLLGQCRSYESIPEGEQILLAWIEAADNVTAKQIESLSCFGKDESSDASSFRVIRTVGVEDAVKVAGVCRSPKFWDGLLRSLTGGSASSYEAAELLSICTNYCLEQGAECWQGLGLAVKETMLKLTTMSASAMLLKDSQVDAGRLTCVVHKLAANTIFPEHDPQSREVREMLINCSLLLLGIARDSHGSLNVSDLSAILLSGTSIRTRRSDFAIDIITSIKALEEHLHSDLTSLLLEKMVDEASSAPLYREVALAGIDAKQQSSENDADEALYAEYIHRITTTSCSSAKRTPRTPFRKNPKAQFRWEEGICEWVAKTPFTAAVAAPPTPCSVPMASHPSHNKENLIPQVETSCASVKKEDCLLPNSPDVLALSSRKRRFVESPLKLRRAKRTRVSHQVPVLPKKAGSRRTTRLSIKSRSEDDSADELGF